MIAEWIVIYAVVFVLCAVVGHIPTKIAARRVRSQRQQRGRDRAAG